MCFVHVVKIFPNLGTVHDPKLFQKQDVKKCSTLGECPIFELIPYFSDHFYRNGPRNAPEFYTKIRKKCNTLGFLHYICNLRLRDYTVQSRYTFRL